MPRLDNVFHHPPSSLRLRSERYLPYSLFRVRTPPQCVYSIIQYPRTDFPKLAHSTITIAHIDCTLQTAPTAPPTTLLAFCFLTCRCSFCLLTLCTGYTLRLYRLYAFTHPSPKPFPVILFHSQSRSHLFVICSYSHLQSSALNHKNFLYVFFPALSAAVLTWTIGSFRCIHESTGSKMTHVV